MFPCRETEVDFKEASESPGQRRHCTSIPTTDGGPERRRGLPITIADSGKGRHETGSARIGAAARVRVDAQEIQYLC